MSQVSKAEDKYIYKLQDSGRTAIWIAHLSDGSAIYQDDGRPGLEPSAWVRLGQYLREAKLHITGMSLKFRSNVVSNIIPENAKGVYFGKSAATVLSSEGTMNFYLVGHLQDDEVVLIKKYAVPELILVGTESRKATKTGASLLRNPDAV